MIECKPALESGQVIKLRSARDLLGGTFYYTAAYWVDGLLIDTGCAHTATQLTSVIGQWAVVQIVNTHSHEDHIGANAELQARFRCTIRAHEQALPILRNPRLQPLQPYRRLFWGWPKPSNAEAIGEWVETEHDRFQVIATPGHSPDHIALFEPEQGWLFSGDTYIGGEDRALRAGYDIHGIIASLKRLSELPVRTIFSGSGTVRSQGVEPLLAKIDYLESLCERIYALADRGLSPRQIRRQLFGREPSISYLTLGHFSGLRLVQSFLNNRNAGLG
jgi:glyoxylase-like metal-dependent hydrolase (beta-lactamase superfamily II)